MYLCAERLKSIFCCKNVGMTFQITMMIPAVFEFPAKKCIEGDFTDFDFWESKNWAAGCSLLKVRWNVLCIIVVALKLKVLRCKQIDNITAKF